MTTNHHPRRYYIGTTAERTALSPPSDAQGTHFFDTDLSVQFYWTGSTWKSYGTSVPNHDHSGDAGDGGQFAGIDALTDLTTGDGANGVVRTDANKGIHPARLGVGAAVPDRDGVVAMAETSDPTSGGAGLARLFFKNAGGQTQLYFMGDQGSVYQIQGIAEDVTVTVGGTGDFATIQGAVDWFKSWVIKGDCVIDADAGAYDEAVSFADLLICPGSTLTLQGDDEHALAGITYVDGAEMNQSGVANGGDGTCALATNGARDQITITGTVANPDFDADGWANGDEIIVYADDGNIYERTINSIDPGGAGTNVIEVTAALPVGATLGNDATAVGLKPSWGIERTAAGYCVTATGNGVILSGWYLEPHTGADCTGIHITTRGSLTIENTLIYAEDHGIRIEPECSCVQPSDREGPISVWSGDRGMYVVGGAFELYYLICIGGNYGIRAQNFANAITYKAIFANQASYGIYCQYHTNGYVVNGTARQIAGTAYYAHGNSAIAANNTNANNNNPAGTDYNPAVSCTPGNCGAVIQWS